jgi:hypothetical protein
MASSTVPKADADRLAAAIGVVEALPEKTWLCRCPICGGLLTVADQGRGASVVSPRMRGACGCGEIAVYEAIMRAYFNSAKQAHASGQEMARAEPGEDRPMPPAEVAAVFGFAVADFDKIDVIERRAGPSLKVALDSGEIGDDLDEVVSASPSCRRRSRVRRSKLGGVHGLASEDGLSPGHSRALAGFRGGPGRV